MRRCSASLLSESLSLGADQAFGRFVMRQEQLGERSGRAFRLRPRCAMAEGVGRSARQLQCVDEPGADFPDPIELGLFGALAVAHDVERSGNAEQITDGVSRELFRAHPVAILDLCSVVKRNASCGGLRARLQDQSRRAMCPASCSASVGDGRPASSAK